MLCCTMHCQWGRKPPKLPPFLLDFVTLPEEDRATAIGNMHKDLVKILCGSGDMLVDVDTHTHTHTQTDILIAILATAPAGEVTI